MNKKIIVISVIGLMIAGIMSSKGDEWFSPQYGTFTNNVSITNNVSRFLTLKYINMGALNTNGGANAVTVWLVNKGDATVVVSNKVFSGTLSANSYTNIRSSELNEFVNNGDVIVIGNTNSTITNEYFLIFSDRQR